MPTLPNLPAEIPLRASEFNLFRELIYKHTGIVLDDNRREMIQSRLRKRLRHLHLSSYREYCDYLTSKDRNGEELQQLINRITTNKTSFFRESHHFDYLRDELFPRLIDQAKRGQREPKLRIWCAAASSGEEPYSLAITVQETFAKYPNWDVRILASDIDTQILEKARAGVYHCDDVAPLPPAMVDRYFDKDTESDTFQVKPSLKQSVAFRQINLLAPQWPIHTQFDAIFCRNVLIYFDQATQDTLMRRMGAYLKQDGSLIIGHSESLSRLSDLYQRIGKTVYLKRQGADQAVSQPSVGQLSGCPVAHAPDAPSPHVQTEIPKPVAAAPLEKKSIIVGDVYASQTPTEINTVVGSCITACLYDPQTRIGGMNHFALPAGDLNARSAANFGVHAMELLINEIMHLGGERTRLVAKVFGGADILQPSRREKIGKRNVDFIRDFLATESIPVVAEHVGGESGMRVLFETHTGRARVKLLDNTPPPPSDQDLAAAKAAQMQAMADVTLF